MKNVSLLRRDLEELKDLGGLSSPKPLRSISIAEQIAEEIAAEILRDQLKAGDRLGEELLAARFQVSRGPVRTALRILERRGLAVSYPRRGVFVAELTPEKFRDAIELRFWLLILAARSCARGRNDESLAGLEAQLTKLKSLARDAKVPPGQFAFEVSFLYQLIAAESGNPRLQPFLQETLDDSAVTLAWRYWSIDYMTVERRLEAFKDFERIVHSIKAHDADGAERAARRHLDGSLTIFLEQMRARANRR